MTAQRCPEPAICTSGTPPISSISASGTTSRSSVLCTYGPTKCPSSDGHELVLTTPHGDKATFPSTSFESTPTGSASRAHYEVEPRPPAGQPGPHVDVARAPAGQSGPRDMRSGVPAVTSAATVSAAWSFRRDGFFLEATDRPFALELFAGSGRLTKHLRDRGLDAWAIDWKDGRLAPETPAILMLNLTVEKDQRAVHHLLMHPRLTYVHMAPPCGTCSRARGIPLSSGQPGPPPLRSEEHPLGLPTLPLQHPREVSRVQAANVLYSFVGEVASALIKLGVLWSIENPRDSLMWWTPAVRSLTDRLDTAFVHFQHCAFGADRPKWTGWLHWPGGTFDALCAKCPGEGQAHTHAKWGQTQAGQYATALEAVYPDRLCSKVVDVLFATFDIPVKPALRVTRARGEPLLKRYRPERAAAGRQAKGGHERQLLPEFERFISLQGDFRAGDARCRPGYTWPACTVSNEAIPIGAKTVRTFFGGQSGAPKTMASSSSTSSPTPSPSSLPSRGCIHECSGLSDVDLYVGQEHRDHQGRFLAASKWASPFKVKDSQSAAECVAKFEAYLRASPALLRALPELAGRRLLCQCRRQEPCHADALISAYAEFVLDKPTFDTNILVGIFRDPASFALTALELAHPFEDHACSRAIVEGLRFRMTSSTETVTKHRRSTLARWTARAAELEGRECQLHAALDVNVNGIVNTKRILLFGEMLKEATFPNADDLVHYLSAGFPLAGDFPSTGVFPPKLKEASLSVADLWHMSAQIRREVISSCRSSGDDNVDIRLYEATLEEVDKGWLKGPLEDTQQFEFQPTGIAIGGVAVGGHMHTHPRSCGWIMVGSSDSPWGLR